MGEVGIYIVNKFKNWKHKDKATEIVSEIELTERDYLFLEVLSDVVDAIRGIRNG